MATSVITASSQLPAPRYHAVGSQTPQSIPPIIVTTSDIMRARSAPLMRHDVFLLSAPWQSIRYRHSSSLVSSKFFFPFFPTSSSSSSSSSSMAADAPTLSYSGLSILSPFPANTVSIWGRALMRALNCSIGREMPYQLATRCQRASAKDTVWGPS